MTASLIGYTLEIGLIYGLVAVGVYLTLRVVDFPDLTVNGSFTLGAAVTAQVLAMDFHPFFAIVFSVLAGGAAGVCTAFLSLKYKIQPLLASIIVMIGLHSVNFRVMGKPNLILPQDGSIYSLSSPLFVNLCIATLVILILAYFLYSEIGLGIRASGQNALVGSAYGVSYFNTVCVVLTLSNALVALAGCLLAQRQGFCDINMGNGIIVIGLASVIIGERIFVTRRLLLVIASCVVGAIAYNFLVALSLDVAGSILMASDIYLITAFLIICIMLSGKRKLIENF